MPRPFRVLAIVSAYNEQDIIEPVLAHLIAQGVDVHVIDDGSTDATRAIAERFRGRGVVEVEAMAPDEGHRFNWSRILARKEAIARATDADWCIHHDADEFRESPWPGVTLADAIERVDREGYNAVDFAVLDFHPTHDRFAAGDDPIEAFPDYEPGRQWNRLQIKCWKKGAPAIDLASSGGHEAAFPNRRVFPLRFLLRHYPIRGQRHGAHKVLVERAPRFRDDERARGWHVQYDAVTVESSFIRHASDLRRYQADGVRAETATEDILALARAHEDTLAREGRVRGELAAAEARIVELSDHLERQIDVHRREAAEYQRRADEQTLQLDALDAERNHLLDEIEAIYASRTWRWTRVFRTLFARVLGR